MSEGQTKGFGSDPRICFNGHTHTDETQAIICELREPDTVAPPVASAAQPLTTGQREWVTAKARWEDLSKAAILREYDIPLPEHLNDDGTARRCVRCSDDLAAWDHSAAETPMCARQRCGRRPHPMSEPCRDAAETETDSLAACRRCGDSAIVEKSHLNGYIARCRRMNCIVLNEEWSTRVSAVQAWNEESRELATLRAERMTDEAIVALTDELFGIGASYDGDFDNDGSGEIECRAEIAAAIKAARGKTK